MSRATDLYYTGEYEFEFMAIDKAIELKPDLAEAWNSKGVVLSDLDRHEEPHKVHIKNC